MEASFKHYDLELINPSFDSPLIGLLFDLEHLKRKRLGGSTDPLIFFQIKEIFHMLESIGSARIEGNRTTVSEFIEKKLEGTERNDENSLEISNIEKCMAFIDDFAGYNSPIDRMFIRELHKRTVEGLNKEGSKIPGQYRKLNVEIKASSHTPPDYTQVDTYMEELLKFINREDESKYDLIKTALAHHRFAWIHPFDNGNGRVARLLTYAMLVKQGFKINIGRIINPTAVFCKNRDLYYNNLEKADQGDESGLQKWCLYMLEGLKCENEKIDFLLDHDYLREKILLPTIEFSLERELITEIESKILRIAVKKQVFRASDLKEVLSGKIPVRISELLKKLKGRGVIKPVKQNSRKYVINVYSSYLLRGIIEMLDKNGFLALVND